MLFSAESKDIDVILFWDYDKRIKAFLITKDPKTTKKAIRVCRKPKFKVPLLDFYGIFEEISRLHMIRGKSILLIT